MAVEPGVIGPATLSLTAAIGLFQGFLPNYAEIILMDPNDPRTVSDVRMGEVAAGVLTLGVGGILSALTGSSVPTYVAMTATAMMVIMYEVALRKRQHVAEAMPDVSLSE